MCPENAWGRERDHCLTDESRRGTAADDDRCLTHSHDLDDTALMIRLRGAR